MKPIIGYHVIGPDDLQWRLSNLMRIPNADFLERTGSIARTRPPDVSPRPPRHLVPRDENFHGPGSDDAED